jgi:hypothetical protein
MPYVVILSEAKNLSVVRVANRRAILRFAQNDNRYWR